MKDIENQIKEDISKRNATVALIDKNLFNSAMEAEYALFSPFIEIYKRQSHYMKENGRWDFNLISEDVGLSVPTCRKWMKRIKTILDEN